MEQLFLAYARCESARSTTRPLRADGFDVLPNHAQRRRQEFGKRRIVERDEAKCRAAPLACVLRKHAGRQVRFDY